jgi:hypothetical protein
LSSDKGKEEEEQRGKEKDDLFFQLVKERYESEFERSTALDDKAGNLIGYVTIVTGLIIGVGTFDLLNRLASPVYYIPYFSGIALLLASMIVSLFAIKTIQWTGAPELKWLNEIWINPQYEYRTMIRQIAIRMVDAIDNTNYKNNENKARLIRYSWVLLIAGLVVLVIYLGIFMVVGAPP